MDTSQEAYEAAAARYDAIASTIDDRRAGLRSQIDALEDEWDAALTELRKHEIAPGLPAWNHAADPAQCKTGGCKIHGKVHA
jgi:hypothetical protein